MQGSEWLTHPSSSFDDTVHIDSSVPASVQVRISGGPGADSLYGGPGADVIEAGDDSAPDLLDGGDGGDALIGARTDQPTPYDSGKSTLIGGEGSDLLVGGDPCDGDYFDGGPGSDTVSFVRFNHGFVAEIGGAVTRATTLWMAGAATTASSAVAATIASSVATVAIPSISNGTQPDPIL
jgi:hypothetical protein